MKRNSILQLAISLFMIFLALPALAQQQEEKAILFLQQQKEKYGLHADDLRELAVTNHYFSEQTGYWYMYLQQRYHGILVDESFANAVFTKEGDLAHMNIQFVDDLESRITNSAVNLTALGAAGKVAEVLQLPSPDRPLIISAKETPSRRTVIDKGDMALEDIITRLMYRSMTDGSLRLAWEVWWAELSGQHYWLYYLDASTGEVLDRQDMVIHCNFDHWQGHAEACEKRSLSPALLDYHPGNVLGATGSYLVWPMPIASPDHGDRELLVDPADSLASPYGWHDTDGVDDAEYTITRGNNVHAYQDRGANNESAGDEPDGGPDLIFEYPYTYHGSANQNVHSAVTNLFYWNNIVHDVLYHHGFTEEAGNFQQNNYGRGGKGGDYVRAEAQDGSGLNNANFSTQPDSMRPRMQMFLFDWTSEIEIENFIVESPSALAGGYESAGSNFGPGLPVDSSITGKLVLVNDGLFPDSTQGCIPFKNAAEVNGNIALIRRGECLETDKVRFAQQAGAIAAVVCNDRENPPVQNLQGDAPDIIIPSGMITMKDCDEIITYLDQGIDVIVSLSDKFPTTPGFTDSDFDNVVIVHEYGHGISNRFTGGPDRTNCLFNREQMGEGWSDYLGLILTMLPGDKGEDPRGVATYALKEPLSGKGFREGRYTTDMDINPFTYNNTNETVTRPHGVGFTWCTMLWDMTWALIGEYGFDPDIYEGTGGNNIALTLVCEGMRLQACRPGFVDGRDGILLADSLLFGEANKCLIWKAFARRGLGLSADQGSPNSRNDQTEAFDIPAECQNEPVADFEVSPLFGCDGSFTFWDNSEEFPDSWQWDFGDGNTSMERNPTHQYTEKGTYEVTLIVTNSAGSDFHRFTVVYDNLPTPVTSDISICRGAAVQLEASGQGNIIWLDQDDKKLHSGPVFNPGLIISTTTFQVEAQTGGETFKAGPVDNTFGKGDYGFTGAMGFTTYVPLTLKSVWVDSEEADTRVIDILDEGVDKIGEIELFIPEGKSRVDLNLELPSPGKYYLSGSGMNLYQNETGTDYPYEQPGIFSIDGPLRVGNRYYFFYDWEVETHFCSSERTTATVSVVDRPIANFTFEISGPSVILTDNSTGATSWNWDFGDGNTSAEQNPTHLYLEPGTYKITLTVGNGVCLVQKVRFVTITATGQRELEGIGNLELRPNIGKGKFTLEVTLRKPAPLEVQVFNTLGQRLIDLERSPASSFTENISVAGYGPGTYFVQVRAGEELAVRRYVLL